MHDRPRHVADQLEALVVSGMRVARINMCHGTRKWHWETIHRKRRLNEEKGYAVAIMMDTEESEIHTGDLGGASSAKAECLLCPGRDEKGVRSAKYYSWKDRRHAFHILEAKRKYVLELGIYFIPFGKVLQSWTLSV